jgi:hypothetical protein
VLMAPRVTRYRVRALYDSGKKIFWAWQESLTKREEPKDMVTTDGKLAGPINEKI